ncbi:MAG: hypothetical protein Q4C71_02385, partial [Microbacteriaceae bacterium]|nr:hypothetical protein [Microbacteriaceae bacterium]
MSTQPQTPSWFMPHKLPSDPKIYKRKRGLARKQKNFKFRKPFPFILTIELMGIGLLLLGVYSIIAPNITRLPGDQPPEWMLVLGILLVFLPFSPFFWSLGKFIFLVLKDLKNYGLGKETLKLDHNGITAYRKT